jgi:hypothetical protein
MTLTRLGVEEQFSNQLVQDPINLPMESKVQLTHGSTVEVVVINVVNIHIGRCIHKPLGIVDPNVPHTKKHILSPKGPCEYRDACRRSHSVRPASLKTLLYE